MGITYENWKTFFFNEKEGQGTLYDRVILHSFFDRFIQKNKIQTVLDCPSFGMTGFSGINSIYLAKKGIKVTIADDNPERILWIKALWEKIGVDDAATFIQIDDWSNLPFEDKSFDLVWNLSSLWHLNEKEVTGVLEELGRIYSQILFMSVHNSKQIVYPLYKKFDKEFFTEVNEKFCKEDFLIDMFHKKLGEINEMGYFVTTPWPGIIIKKEEFFGGKKTPFYELPLDNNIDNIKMPEYITYLQGPPVKGRINKLMFLERLPKFIKKYWSHLTYFIFQNKSYN